jgi:predicted ATPase/predicted Ser/Thr protein kinase
MHNLDNARDSSKLTIDSKSLRSRGYEVKEEIGAGGFGVVYRASQPSVGRDVAIKVILPEIAQDPEFARRFAEEARLAAQLEHPNIVPLYDYWQDEERAYLVMRWLKGGSLHDLLKQGPLDRETSVRVVTQITSALENAHEQGIVHRDLKPANVLLDQKGNAYLSDFGIAKHLLGAAFGTVKGTLIGSPAYMAPESITGGQLTTLSDLYGLGLMLFEIVTGETPYGDLDTAAMLYSQVNEPVPLASQKNPALRSEVDRVIQKATAKQPEDRYSDPASLSEAFAEAMIPEELRLAADEEQPPLHNLPLQITPFIGREDEVAAIVAYLEDPETRLVTVVGPGGMGKTRLALATAESQIGRFEHGVFFISLAPLEDPKEIALSIGWTIGFSFPGGADPTQELVNYLRRRSMLLVLDNFEHLISGALVVSEIIRSARGVRIIVTTRQRLRLQDEQLYHLQGLSFPSQESENHAADYAAVQLFMQSATRLKEDFVLDQTDLAAITQICRLIQGMPLGILLSAGWIEMLSPSEIYEELSQGMDILETSLQDLPERQRSMRAVFDYTWEYLNPKEREHLGKLSVFRGGCSIQAARKITRASLPTIRSLLDKSLIQATESGRYELHELLRQYAAEKLADDPGREAEIYDAHCVYYLNALADRENALFSDHFVETMADIDADLDNVNAAWRWAIETRRIELLEKAMVCFCYYHYWHNNVQSLFKNTQLIIEPFTNSQNPRERLLAARALLYQGWYLPNQEDKALVERSLDILREPSLDQLDTRAAKAFGLSRLGHIESLSDTDKSRELLLESLALSRMIGDRHGEAGVLLRLSNLASNNSDFEEGERFARMSQAIRDDIGNPLEGAESLRTTAYTLAMQGKEEDCLDIVQKLESVADSVGERYAAAVLGALPAIYRQIGLYEEAYRRYGEVVAASENSGDLTMVRSSSLWKAWVGIHLGHYLKFLSIAGDQKNLYSSHYYLGHLELGQASALLGLNRPAEALEQSRKAVESFRHGGLIPRLSQSLATLVLALRASGDGDTARKSLAESLRLAIEMKSPPVLCHSLSAAALLLLDQEEGERAISLYNLARRYPVVTNSQWFHDVAGEEIESLAHTLPPAESEAAEVRGGELDLWDTAGDLLREFQTSPNIE